MADPNLSSTARPAQSDLPLADIYVVGLFALVGGLLFGALTYLVFSYLWLIVLFPIIIGFLVGFVYAWIIRVFRVRSIIAVVLAGVATSVLIYLTSFYLQYRDFQTLPGAEDVSFWSFMQLNASSGFTIGKFGGDGIPVNGIFFWLYTLAEIGVTGFIIVTAGAEMSEQPFCEQCKNWYQSGQLIGSVALEQIPEFDRAIQKADYQQASALIQAEYSGPERLDVYLARCKNSAHDLILRVDQVETEKDKAKKKELWRRAIGPDYAQFFQPS